MRLESVAKTFPSGLRQWRRLEGWTERKERMGMSLGPS